MAKKSQHPIAKQSRGDVSKDGKKAADAVRDQRRGWGKK